VTPPHYGKQRAWIYRERPLKVFYFIVFDVVNIIQKFLTFLHFTSDSEPAALFGIKPWMYSSRKSLADDDYLQMLYRAPTHPVEDDSRKISSLNGLKKQSFRR